MLRSEDPKLLDEMRKYLVCIGKLGEALNKIDIKNIVKYDKITHESLISAENLDKVIKEIVSVTPCPGVTELIRIGETMWMSVVIVNVQD